MSSNKILDLMLVMTKYSHAALLDEATELKPEIRRILQKNNVMYPHHVIGIYGEEITAAFKSTYIGEKTEDFPSSFGRAVQDATGSYGGNVMLAVMKLIPACYNVRLAKLNSQDEKAIDEIKENLNYLLEVFKSASYIKQMK
jgi:hypothetical protein